MKAPQISSRKVKLQQNGEISLLINPSNRNNGFINFDAAEMTALTVLQICDDTASPSAEIVTGPPLGINAHFCFKIPRHNV